MNKKETEALIIFQEECAECIQVVSKIFRFGYDSETLNGELNSERLTKEVADLLAMVDILADLNLIPNNSLEDLKNAKKEKLKKWSSLFDEYQANADK